MYFIFPPDFFILVVAIMRADRKDKSQKQKKPCLPPFFIVRVGSKYGPATPFYTSQEPYANIHTPSYFDYLLVVDSEVFEKSIINYYNK